MDCQAIQKLIPLYMDKELQPDEMKGVKDHLSGCATCRKEFEAYEASWAMLGELEPIEPEPGFIGRFWTRLSYEQTWQEKLQKALRNSFVKRRLVPVLVTACLVIVVGSLVLRDGRQTGTSEQVLAGLSQDELEVVQYMELAENFEVIKEIDLLEDLEMIEQMEEFKSGSLNKKGNRELS